MKNEVDFPIPEKGSGQPIFSLTVIAILLALLITIMITLRREVVAPLKRGGHVATPIVLLTISIMMRI